METLLMFVVDELLSIKSLIPIPISEYNEWQYPITSQFLTTDYKFEYAQQLCCFSYNITKHNYQVYLGMPAIPILPPNFDIVIPLAIKEKNKAIILGFFCHSTSLNMSVITFTGSYAIEIWKADFNYHQITPTNFNNYVTGMKVHGGLYRLYLKITTQLYTLLEQYTKPDTQICTTGQSAGGALSYLCLLDLYNRSVNNFKITKLINYAFSTPIIFNTVGANHFNSLKLTSYQIINKCDIVPMTGFSIMPTNEDFTPINGAITFTKNLKSYPSNHVLSYLEVYKIHL